MIKSKISPPQRSKKAERIDLLKIKHTARRQAAGEMRAMNLTHSEGPGGEEGQDDV